jgi:hypothetical protein
MRRGSFGGPIIGPNNEHGCTFPSLSVQRPLQDGWSGLSDSVTQELICARHYRSVVAGGECLRELGPGCAAHESPIRKFRANSLISRVALFGAP